jgi:hypothetical protein
MSVRGRLTRAVLAVAAVVAGGVLGTAAPASAGPGLNPTAYCDSHYFEYLTTGNRVVEAYWVPMQYIDEGGQPQLVGFPIESREGCISTLARGLRNGAVDSGRFSLPATRAQCQYLEETFGITYPFVFYGQFEARNRTECGQILQDLLAVLPPPANGPPL